MLPKGSSDATPEMTEYVKSVFATAWPTVATLEIEHTANAWNNLLHLTNGNFGEYYQQITAGYDSDQQPLFSFGVVISAKCGMGTKQLITKFISVAAKPCYYLNLATGEIHLITGMHKATKSQQDGYRVVYDGQPPDELI